MKHVLKRTPLGLTAICLFGLQALPASAHEGHGLPSMSHWHSTDVLGFVIGAVMAVAILWFKGDK